MAGGGLIAVVWQEFVQNAAGQREAWLTASVSRDAGQWRTNARFAGPFPRQEQETPIFSLAVDRGGRILIAAAAAERRTSILASRDGGQSFTQLASVEAFATSLAPSLFVTSRGELLLIVTQEQGTFLSQQYALSVDGTTWTPFQPLLRDEQLQTNFLAQHAVFAGRDYLVFQTLRRGDRRYQLQLMSSADGGRSWGPATPLAFDETVDGRPQGAELFDNQRPFLLALPDRLALAWERQFQSRAVRVYYQELDGQGAALGPPQAVTEGAVAAHFPRLIRYRERAYVFYFSGADRVFVAEPGAAGWSSRELNELTGSSYFAYPVELAGRLYVFWENRIGNNSRLIVLQPDQSVEAPRLQAVNFDPRRASRQDLVLVRWSVPADSSGLAGFKYVWSQNPAAPLPPGDATMLADVTSASVRAEQDGAWYFRVAAQDYAGNWSEPAVISFTRDTVPPGRPALILPPVDPEGYLAANSFQIAWRPENPEDAAGYAINLQYLGPGEVPAEAAAPPLPAAPNTTATRAAYENLDNGLWAFAVAAVDASGNRGQPTTAILRLNKYVPVTYISFVNDQRDALGATSLTVGGRGFELDGLVDRVLLDRDAAPPLRLQLHPRQRRLPGRLRPADPRLDPPGRRGGQLPGGGGPSCARHRLEPARSAPGASGHGEVRGLFLRVPPPLGERPADLPHRRYQHPGGRAGGVVPGRAATGLRAPHGFAGPGRPAAAPGGSGRPAGASAAREKGCHDGSAQTQGPGVALEVHQPDHGPGAAHGAAGLHPLEHLHDQHPAQDIDPRPGAAGGSPAGQPLLRRGGQPESHSQHPAVERAAGAGPDHGRGPVRDPDRGGSRRRDALRLRLGEQRPGYQRQAGGRRFRSREIRGSAHPRPAGPRAGPAAHPGGRCRTAEGLRTGRRAQEAAGRGGSAAGQAR